MKIKKITTISLEEIYRLCNDNGYYTRGDNASYDRMLHMPYEYDYADNRLCLKDMKDEDYIEIAQDIFEHSNVEKLTEECGITETELMESILSGLYNYSYTKVKIEKGE